MFSGIVEDIVKLKKKQKLGDIYQIQVVANSIFQLQPGESIALDGVCLTLKKFEKANLFFDVISSTYENTRFKYLKSGELINLERALRIQQPLSGHLLTGHIDCVLPLSRLERKKNTQRIYFRIPSKYKAFVVEKGSLAVNGVSLTIQGIKNDVVSLDLIPFTLQHTNLSRLRRGDKVNIEFDILAKYIANYLKLNTTKL